MSNTKKIKGPGRPKSNFKNLLKNKEDKHIIRGRGRPKKHIEIVEEDNLVDKELKGVVDEKVAREKKKDTIILLLFIFSVLLFIFSILSSFLQKKKNDLLNIKPVMKQEKIVNISTGITEVITGNTTSSGNNLPTPNQTINTGLTIENENLNPERKVTEAGQSILDFYDAFNTKDIQTLNSIADTHLRSSSVFRTYFNINWISKFLLGIVQSKVFVLGIIEKEDALKPNIKNIDYSITYRVNNVSDKFVEQRSATLIKRGEEWKIGKIMCVTPGCSLMPFFNPAKYGIK